MLKKLFVALGLVVVVCRGKGGEGGARTRTRTVLLLMCAIEKNRSLRDNRHEA